MKQDSQIWRTVRTQGLFGKEDESAALSRMGNPLEELSSKVDFEMFREELEAVCINTAKKSNAGRHPIDPVMMFKVLFLQRYYGLSDHQIQYQITDRTSFKQFLGIEDVRDVPDEKTVWKFREVLSNAGLFDRLFDKFITFLRDRGYEFTGGKIIDASFVVAPRQRNTHDENKTIKEGRGNELWNDKPHKKCHKDIDASWTKKRGETFYGYKAHVKANAGSKFVEKYRTTTAKVHDSQVITPLLTKDDEGEKLFLDAGYVGPNQEREVRKAKMMPVICEKGYRNHPLTDEQKASNRIKSKTRCLIEHVFGFMEQTMGGLVFRGVGQKRAESNVAMTCLTYNVCRFCQVTRSGKQDRLVVVTD